MRLHKEKQEQVFDVILSKDILQQSRQAMPMLFQSSDMRLKLENWRQTWQVFQQFKAAFPSTGKLLVNHDIGYDLSQTNLVKTNSHMPVSRDSAKNFLLASREQPCSSAILAKLETNIHRQNLKQDFLLALRFEESGFLIYKDIGSEAYSSFSLLHTLLRSFSDFSLPIYVAETAKNFLLLAKTHKPRIFVFPYLEQSFTAKKLFVALRRRNPFAKTLEVNEEKLHSPRLFHQELSKLYAKDHLKAFSQPKTTWATWTSQATPKWLDSNSVQKLQKRITYLQNHYDEKNHVIIEYALYKLGINLHTEKLLLKLQNIQKQENSYKNHEIWNL